jgi:hypothetical protein
MVDTDSNYSEPAVGNTQITPVRVLHKHKDPPPAQVTAHKSSRKASNEIKSVRLLTNVDEIKGMVQDITKQLQGQDIDRIGTCLFAFYELPIASKECIWRRRRKPAQALSTLFLLWSASSGQHARHIDKKLRLHHTRLLSELYLVCLWASRLPR